MTGRSASSELGRCDRKRYCTGMSGATEETHENVVTARFMRGTVWPCRFVITAVNVDGKRRGQPRFEPFPFRRHRLNAAFVLCMCAHRDDVMGWCHFWEASPRLRGWDADRNLSDRRRSPFVKKKKKQLLALTSRLLYVQCHRLQLSGALYFAQIARFVVSSNSHK